MMRIKAMTDSHMLPKNCLLLKRGRAPFNLAVYFHSKFSKKVQALLGIYAKPFTIVKFETTMILIKTLKSPNLVCLDLEKEGFKTHPFQIVTDATEENVRRIVKKWQEFAKVVVRGPLLSGERVVFVNRSFGKGEVRVYLRSFNVYGYLCLGISFKGLVGPPPGFEPGTSGSPRPSSTVPRSTS